MKAFYKFTSTLFIVFFFVIPILASSPKAIWRAGHLLLWNKTVLEGDVSYNWAAEMVLFRQPDGRMHTYSANQVARFGWFDIAQHKHRNFVSLLKSVDKDRANQVFFEVCLDGPLTIVRRLGRPHGLFKRLFSHPAYATDRPVMAQNHELFDYFVYDASHLLALDRFYVDIYRPFMTTYSKELRHYIQTHNINDRSTLGRIVIIERYNSLVQQESKTASSKGFTSAPN